MVEGNEGDDGGKWRKKMRLGKMGRGMFCQIQFNMVAERMVLLLLQGKFGARSRDASGHWDVPDHCRGTSGIYRGTRADDNYGESGGYRSRRDV